ncbi:soluble scavenger receptor cysteine-rich domain-containing protein SSC5D isoform X2 [Alligator mississippiensis]|uniref:soluble scavenger receptor cysteine-rich domain-containing protein SSC5D isoform X2 n=1 Tax=Alligator mississippiensis TaxID=8496 RepID=UPI000907498D|nr:soluble scavenger receptor cysteine-rich domain-containing protein SSC5D isoform X2 [Alligator mississippiensis]
MRLPLLLLAGFLVLHSSGPFQVRLAGGPSQCAGRVELNYKGRWGSVCDDDWDMLDATVVCRQLGCGTALSAPLGAWFGEGTGPIWLNEVRCQGTERHLQHCQHRGWRQHICTHEEDASAVCSAHRFLPVTTAVPSSGPAHQDHHPARTRALPQPTTSPHGGVALRLVEGPHRCAGRLEVLHQGQWGTVCDDDWGLKDGAVVCRELGCGVVQATPGGSHFGSGTGPIWLDDVGCSGKESLLRQCQAQPWGQSNCNHSEDAGVICTGGAVLRLVGGRGHCAGRLEVYHEGVWGTVCDDMWALPGAAVVCRELGCGDPLSAPGGAFFGEGHGPIWLDNVRCQGNESALSQCLSAPWGVHDCQHGEDAAVVCTDELAHMGKHPAMPAATQPQMKQSWSLPTAAPRVKTRAKARTKGAPRTGLAKPVHLRLSGGPGPCAGRVEVLHTGRWGTVCDDSWDLADATVVCRELGCGAALWSPGGARYGPGSGPIWLDEVNCTGREPVLRRCQADPWGQHNCNHHEDASVICAGKGNLLLLEPTRTQDARDLTGTMQRPWPLRKPDLVGTTQNTRTLRKPDLAGTMQRLRSSRKPDPHETTQSTQTLRETGLAGTTQSTQRLKDQGSTSTTWSTQTSRELDLAGPTQSTQSSRDLDLSRSGHMDSGSDIQTSKEPDPAVTIWSTTQTLRKLGLAVTTQSTQTLREPDLAGTTQNIQTSRERGLAGTTHRAWTSKEPDPVDTMPSTKTSREVQLAVITQRLRPSKEPDLAGTKWSLWTLREPDQTSSTWSPQTMRELDPKDSSQRPWSSGEPEEADTMRSSWSSRELDLASTTRSLHTLQDSDLAGATPLGEITLAGTRWSPQPSRELDETGTTKRPQASAEPEPHAAEPTGQTVTQDDLTGMGHRVSPGPVQHRVSGIPASILLTQQPYPEPSSERQADTILQHTAAADPTPWTHSEAGGRALRTAASLVHPSHQTHRAQMDAESLTSQVPRKTHSTWMGLKSRAPYTPSVQPVGDTYHYQTVLASFSPRPSSETHGAWTDSAPTHAQSPSETHTTQIDPTSGPTPAPSKIYSTQTDLLPMQLRSKIQHTETDLAPNHSQTHRTGSDPAPSLSQTHGTQPGPASSQPPIHTQGTQPGPAPTPIQPPTSTHGTQPGPASALSQSLRQAPSAQTGQALPHTQLPNQIHTIHLDAASPADAQTSTAEMYTTYLLPGPLHTKPDPTPVPSQTEEPKLDRSTSGQKISGPGMTEPEEAPTMPGQRPGETEGSEWLGCSQAGTVRTCESPQLQKLIQEVRELRWELRALAQGHQQGRHHLGAIAGGLAELAGWMQQLVGSIRGLVPPTPPCPQNLCPTAPP